MGKRAKFVGLIMLMQTGCLAAGVWLQHFCIRWSTREALWKSNVATMASRAAALAQRSPEDLSRSDYIAGFAGEGWGVLYLDDHWTIRSAEGGKPEETALFVGRAIEWRSEGVPDGQKSVAAAGTFELQGSTHFAAAHSMVSGSGYVVVHRSDSALEEDISMVLAGQGGVSFITLVWTSALMGICVFVAAGRFCDQADLEKSRTLLEAMRQRQDLIRTRDAVIFGLAKLTESRDPETGDHLDRISLYATTLATAMMKHPDFAAQITPSFVRLIEISAALHDIGKVGVEDRILLKPGRLTATERALMEDHSRIGGECLLEIERRLGQSNFLQMARDIAFSHHERWDGSGYPRGLRGEQIPLAARIVAIADVYDAVTSRRVYKEPRAHEKCVELIREGAGAQFDPRIVEVWLSIAPRFKEISDRFSDLRTPSFEERDEAPPVRDKAPVAAAASAGGAANAHGPDGRTAVRRH